MILHRLIHTSTRKHIKTSYHIPLIALLFALLITCNTAVVYDYNKSLPGSVWNLEDKVSFQVEIKDTTGTFDFYLKLRHNTDYKYNNVYFFVNTTFPDQQFARDTVEFILADKEGKWHGKGFGSIKDLKILLKKGVMFPIPGIYVFELEQAMREENLKGIMDIGISIEKP